MINIKNSEFWFIVGSQFLYGKEVLDTVDQRAQEMAQKMGKKLPANFKYKGTMKTADEITEVMKLANASDECLGVVVWCHTFSPSKMWINGLSLLQKPYCHFATQYNRTIPNDEIDMDFMNLNQAAHGDREHGFIGARLRLPRKIIVGFWEDEAPLKELSDWMRSAIGFKASKELKVMRFGDNMREVAVTEGDKVEAQIKLGWQVNTWPVGYLVKEMEEVAEQDIDQKMEQYKTRYEIITDEISSIRYQAKQEIAMSRIFEREGISAFSNTFQDLYGMEQLPGIASQNLMMDGYGYAGEGDWKTSAMTHIIKAMTQGLSGGTSFMEDYTYHLEKRNELSLGAHMLEVCPSVAKGKAKIEVHHLGIGDKNPPARLVFEGKKGQAVLVTLIDIGGRMRLIVQDVECVEPIMDMPNLPVARVMWKALPDLCTGTKFWIMAGGAHHSVLSYDANATMLKDFAELSGIEVVHLSANTTEDSLKQQLFLNDIAFKLN